jgi:hypothetical protein
MKLKILALMLVGFGAMASAASAQIIGYRHKGKHHDWGIVWDLGGSRSYRSYSYGYAPVYQYSYVPAYGYHTHHADTHVTPFGASTTTYNHFGPVHPPSHTTTYYSPYYYAPRYTYSYGYPYYPY